MKVLVADNMKSDLDLATGFVDSLGYLARPANTGRQVLAAFERERPDVVILGSDLKDLEGNRVASTLRIMAGPEWLPVLIAVPSLTDRHVILAVEAGADECVQKPLCTPAFRAKLAFLQRVTELRRSTSAAGEEVRALRDELRGMTHVDAVTGLANRRFLDAELLRAWNRSCRSGEPLTLLMIKVDDFAAYTDAVGQVVADASISRIGSSLASAARRADDCLARYNDDHFAIILSDTQADGIEIIGQRLTAEVNALALPRADGNGAVTITVASATIAPSLANRVSDLIRAAEQAVAAKTKQTLSRKLVSMVSAGG